jgi:hypothetical protein
MATIRRFYIAIAYVCIMHFDDLTDMKAVYTNCTTVQTEYYGIYLLKVVKSGVVSAC